VFPLYSLIGRPPHIRDLSYLKHLLVVYLHFIELMCVSPVYGMCR